MKTQVATTSFLIVTVLIGLVSSSVGAFADPKSPNKFYEPGFTENILKKSRRPSPTPSTVEENSTTTAPEQNKTSETAEFVFAEDSPTPSPTPSPIPTQDPKDLLRATPILSLGIILNGSTAEHVNTYIGQLTQISFKYNLPIHKVIYIGPLIAPPEDGYALAIGLQGGESESYDSMPIKYPVSRSPTWIVETDKGEILLEGILDVSRYLNSKGEFVEPTAPGGVSNRPIFPSIQN